MTNGQTSGAYDRFMLAGELADKLGREVDLIDFAEASPVFRAQIIGNGIFCCKMPSRLNGNSFLCGR
ncbi:hypothetical protein J2Z22_001696 [Paenibacillus forsythiae]|uniref:Uncharacterized protein n=1 Tax=Paenibacillus forsythiae TaxID=365616 RepID=A0ABU3H5S3_9BACL|nr:nucleotidyltransferase domain-containing protein [Paenibacillus forsythiae]MDT3426176.1 hypothetical protein [Paenibacillus forsythiae]